MDVHLVNGKNELYNVVKQLIGSGKEFEICLRDSKKHFEEFHKIVLNGDLDTNKDLEEIKNLFSVIKKGLDQSINQMSAMGDKMDKYNDKLDKILSMQGSFKSLQMLSAGIGLANLCVTIVGFQIMNEKLNKISSEINQVLAEVQNIHSENLIYGFDKVCAEYSEMLNREKKIKKYTEEEYRVLIDQEYLMIKRLLRAFRNNTSADKKDIVYSILALSQMMSFTICKYDEISYFTYESETPKDQRWHPSHKEWTSIYQELYKRDFLREIQYLMFIEEGLNQYETDLLVTSLRDTFKEAEQEIVNHQAIIQKVDDRLKYEKLQKTIKSIVVSQIDETIEEMNASESVVNLFKSAQASLGLS